MNATQADSIWLDRWFAPPRAHTVVLGLALLGITAASVGTGWQRMWLLLVLSPLVEECVFRAGMQEYLLTRLNSAFWAIVLTALAFGLLHAAVRADVSALVAIAPALLVGAVYARWRRLRWCVGLHAAMNGLWLCWSLTS